MKLSTYSWLVVVVAAAVAAIGWLGLAGWMAVAVLAASVAMHVAGNAIGTRLRERTDRELTVSDRPVAAAVLPTHSPGRLERSESLGRLVPVSAAIGGVIGGVVGTAALSVLVKSSMAGAALGGVSSAVIGALVGFLLASAVEIFRAALRDAIAAQEADCRHETSPGIASKATIDLVPYDDRHPPPRGDSVP